MEAGAAGREGTSSGVNLSEIVGSIAIASDLGLGQPLEHVLRSCVIATRVADRLDASQENRDATYWATLFVAAGCTGVSFELAAIFGDDIAFRAGTYDTLTNFSFLRFAMRRADANGGVLRRTKVRVDLLRSGMSSVAASLLAHCAVSAELARRLDLGDAVIESLLQTFEQWDGKGMPNKLRGEQVRLPIRIANLATMVEVHDRSGGPDASRRAARKGAATVGPDLVDSWCEMAEEILTGVDAESSWQQVVAAQPRGRPPLTNRELDAALELMADYADLKSPWLNRSLTRRGVPGGRRRATARAARRAARHAASSGAHPRHRPQRCPELDLGQARAVDRQRDRTRPAARLLHGPGRAPRRTAGPARVDRVGRPRAPRRFGLSPGCGWRHRFPARPASRRR